MKRPGTIPGRSNTRGLPGLGKATKTAGPSAPTDPRASTDPTNKKKKKLKTVILTHGDPEGHKDSKKIKGKPHSSPEGRFLSKLRTQPLVVKYNKGGRAGYQGGGRTDLLEELGRVEGEHSNKNRRDEVARIHGELNKGYKGGKRVGLQHGGSTNSAGAVLPGKKVGIQKH